MCPAMYRSCVQSSKVQYHSHQSGVTLIELMIVIVILGILSTVGVPSFVNMIKDSRLSAQTSAVVGTFSFARSEAIKRNATVCVVSDDSGWASGWEVRADCSGTPEVLRVFDPLEGGNTLTCKDDCAQVDFNGSGITSSEELTLCDDRNEGRKFSLRITGNLKIDRENHGCS